MHLADYVESLSPSPLNAPAKIEDGIVIIEPRRKKVCIYGAGLFRRDAPLGDPEWEVWAINVVPPVYSFDGSGERFLRADRWFDLHQRCAQSKDDLRWIAKCPVPIYLPPDLVDASPLGVLYPLDEIEEFFSTSYWACTFAYQIALAIYEGFEEIGLHGVELAYGSQRERSVEFANVAYWLGRAQERGLKISLPSSKNSFLLKHPGRYGFEYIEELEAVKKYSDRMDLGDAYRRSEKEGGVGVGG